MRGNCYRFGGRGQQVAVGTLSALMLILTTSACGNADVAAGNSAKGQQRITAKAVAAEGQASESPEPRRSSSSPNTRLATARPKAKSVQAPKPRVPSAAQKSANKRAIKRQKPGDVHKAVPAKKVPVKKAVSIQANGTFGNQVSVKVLKRQAVHGKARLPGEISGPAVKLTLRVVNKSGEAINLNSVVVDLRDAKGRSASPLLTPPAHHLSGNLASGSTDTGEYLFTLPKKDRHDCAVRISYTADLPVVVFSGDLP